jgi:TolA-binding protein
MKVDLLKNDEAPEPQVKVDSASTSQRKAPKKQSASSKKANQSKRSKTSRRSSAHRPTIESILSQAYQLTPHELTQLIEILSQLKEVQDAQLDEDERREQEEQEFERQRRCQGRSPRIEAKIINGCGPYDYLRWWDGKTYKSTYLGKSKG